MSSPPSPGGGPSLREALEDLEFRFLSDLTTEEIEDPPRLFFQLELAYWYYEDNLVDAYSHLPHFEHLETFSKRFFSASRRLQPYLKWFDAMYQSFSDYKWTIPVYGCALLNSDLTKVVLVRGYKQDTWGFPRGKVNEDEDELKCAIREAEEETGYDPTSLNPSRDDFLVWNQRRKGGEKRVTIFVIPGVPEDYPFAPTVKKEIDEVKWHFVSDLPMPGTGREAKHTFWGVSPMLPQLKSWIARRRGVSLGSQSDTFPLGGQQSTDDDARADAAESFEEMVRINRELRQRELADDKSKQSRSKPATKAPKASPPGTASKTKSDSKGPDAKSSSASKQADKPKTKSKSEKAMPLEPKTILKRPNSAQGGVEEEFSIDWARVQAAMRPFLDLKV